jgi:hypothetical protein
MEPAKPTLGLSVKKKKFPHGQRYWALQQRLHFTLVPWLLPMRCWDLSQATLRRNRAIRSAVGLRET